MSVLHPIDSVACIGERILSGVGDVVTSAFDSVFGGIVDWLTGLVTDAVAAAASTLGTFWVSIDTPPVGNAGNTPTSTIGFITDHLGWYTAALAVLSILVGAGRMALQRKAQAGVDTARSVVQFAVVSGAGVAVTALLTEAADQFSVWIIGQSTGGDFGSNLTTLLAFSTVTGGLVIVLVLGLLAILASFIQVILMVMRIAMIYLLIATLPTAAAATSTEFGRQWFKKLVAWLIAFILYKPVASIIYALAFRLVGDTSVFAAGGLMSVLVGVALMLMALLGLPALMRFLVPAVSSVASGAGAGAIAAGALATGATLAAGASGGGFGGGGSSAGGGSAGGAAGGGAAGPAGAGQTGPSSATSPGSGGGDAAAGGSLMASAGDTSAAPPPAGGGGSSGGRPDGSGGSGSGGSWSPPRRGKSGRRGNSDNDSDSDSADGSV